MELIDGGMNPVGEELPELDEQRLRSKRENGEMVGLAWFDQIADFSIEGLLKIARLDLPVLVGAVLSSERIDRSRGRSSAGTTFRIQDRRNLIYGFSGRLRNTALTIKSEFFSQKDAGSKATIPWSGIECC
jgi:hypothetical protein